MRTSETKGLGRRLGRVLRNYTDLLKQMKEMGFVGSTQFGSNGFEELRRVIGGWVKMWLC